MKKEKQICVALAGNPNVGKTSIFNSLTGSRQHVGNYPGVTVEKKEGFTKYQDWDITFVDLPGSYSLNPYTPDEVVAREFITDEQCDALVAVLDAANIERNLYFLLQLLEMEKPTIAALNMVDAAKNRKIEIDSSGLAKKLGIPVIETVGNRNQGTKEVLATLVKNGHKKSSALAVDYGPEIEKEIQLLIEKLSFLEAQLKAPKRWVAIKLLEDDQEVKNQLANLPGGREILAELSGIRENLAKELADDVALLITSRRYLCVAELCRGVVNWPEEDIVTTSDKIDVVLAHRYFGIPIFFGLMYLVFQSIFTLGAYPQGWIEAGVEKLSGFLTVVLPVGGVQDLIVGGMLGGVGNVIVFLPNILLLFFFISLLEDTGYMARIAFLMDRIMHSLGLHGKSFIPMLLGFGCTVTAVMATRTLENRRDRIVTILVAPLMNCSARIPVYILLASAFFAPSTAGMVIFSIYILGIGLAILMAKIFRQTLFQGENEPFIMEMPPYRLPSLKNILRQMWERSVLYIQKAGTIILAMSVIIWFLTNYPHGDMEQSYAALIGKALEPLVAPLGFDWKIALSLLTALTAKEVLVSSLGTIYNVDEAGETALSAALLADPAFSPLVAYVLMVFVLIYPPCIAAIAVIHRETKSWKWTGFSFAYSIALAWIVSFVIYRVGLLGKAAFSLESLFLGISVILAVWYIVKVLQKKLKGSQCQCCSNAQCPGKCLSEK